MKEQRIWMVEQDYSMLKEYFKEKKIASIFLVCGSSFAALPVGKYIKQCVEEMGIRLVEFSEFTPNPKYEEIVNGTALLKQEKSDLLLAVGGGSAIDVAKCMKLYCNMNSSLNYLEQEIVPNKLQFMAIPTTAGTGSEVTRFAVIYYRGEKQSVMHESCIPDAVLLDASVLESLSTYQKKATMLDALCHAVESYWSVNSTEESKYYSEQAIRLILENKDGYLKNEKIGNKNMLLAAHIAGKAINITQTTAGHAMCYKLTGLYHISHGHAAALCVAVLWAYMLENVDSPQLKAVFLELSSIMDGKTMQQGVELFRKLLQELEMEIPKIKEEEFTILKHSVNPIRLKNNPMSLSEDVLEQLYRELSLFRK